MKHLIIYLPRGIRAAAADDHDAAFAVYTSGSTGAPKGVLHEYGSLKFIHLTNIKRPGIDGNPGARTALTVASVEKKSKVMIKCVFNNRTDRIKRNAFGFLVSGVYVCIEADPDLTVGSFFSELRKRLNDMTVINDYEESYFADANLTSPNVNAVAPEANEKRGLLSIGGERQTLEEKGSYNYSTVIYVIEYTENIIATILQNERFSKEQRSHIQCRFQQISDMLLSGSDPYNLKIGELFG